MGSKNLTTRSAQTAPIGWHCDGHGLYLQCTKGADGSINRSWVYRYGERYMGLGPLRDVSLAEAREKAASARKLRLEGIDPIEARNTQRTAARLEAAKATTFGQCVETFLEFKRPEWSNPKHAAQWAMTLREYAKPLHPFPPAAIDLPLVVKTLQPLWMRIPETAGRTRQRIEAVLDHWAATNEVHGYSNPAAWERVKHALPSVAKLKGDRHHPALPYERMGEFMRDLRTRDGTAARALEFLTLCVCRTGDIIGNQREEKPPMRWKHVDSVKRLWTIPSTKTDKRHIVPLSDAAMAILKKRGRGRDDEIVFPGAKAGQPLSNAAMAAVIDRMNDDGGNYIDPKEDDRAVVPHGLRSSFRDWAGDCTSFDHQTIEFALAHQIDDKTERAYARATAVEKRRRLMMLWSQYCEKAPSKVLPFAKVLDGSQRRV